MAVFKLGAIVTAIAGSVGGTNFRRGISFNVISNKSFGGSKSNLLNNVWLNAISNIFKQWAKLTQLQRDDWNLIALNYTFPDKFGVLRNLTGRQLFTKLSIQLMPVGVTTLEPDQINNTISTVTLQNFDLTETPFHAELQLETVGADNWILVQIEVTKRTLLSPQFTRRKISAFMYGAGAIGFDITNEILAQFPYIDSSYNVRAFVTLMNESGFKNVTQFYDGVWVT
jgi:hypothetical protein